MHYNTWTNLYQNIWPQKHKNYVMRYLVILSILIWSDSKKDMNYYYQFRLLSVNFSLCIFFWKHFLKAN